MPPPRRSDRKRVAESTTDSPSKRKPAKNKREMTYDTYDEAMDGGVEMEEKGERYKDGEKAQRFYEKALELYQKAWGFQQTYDAAYNQARVLYTLGTSFLLPPTAIQTLQSSLDLCRQATTLTNSPLLLIDCMFNYSQTAISLADMLEDKFGDAQSEEIRTLRMQAKDTLEEVLAGQITFLEKAEESDSRPDSEVAAEDAIEEIEAGAAQPAEAESKTDDADENMEVDAEEGESQDNEGQSDSYETHLPTKSTLVDTVLVLIDTHLSLWESATPLQPPTEIEQSTVRNILDSTARFVPPGRQAEMDLVEIKVLLTADRIIWDLYKSQATVGHGLEKSLEGATMALSSLLASLDTSPPDEPSLTADILTTLADTHIAIANRMMFLNPQLPAGPSPLAQQAWHNFSTAIGYLGKALDLPSHANQPIQFKPSVLLSLSKASLARAGLAGVNDTAQRNLPQLLENAQTYIQRALKTLGWESIKLPPESTGSTIEPPYPTGWDTEVLAREAILHVLRIQVFMAEKDDTALPPLTSLIDISQKIEDPARRLTKRDVLRWIEEVEEEEGEMKDELKFWWEAVAQPLGL